MSSYVIDSYKNRHWKESVEIFIENKNKINTVTIVFCELCDKDKASKHKTGEFDKGFSQHERS